MVFVRRLYVFVVCFISLQWAALALRAALFAGVMLFGSEREAGGYLTGLLFALAVLAATVPIFLGHWASAEWLARRDDAEKRSTERALYLHLTQAALTAFLAFNLFWFIEALAQVVIPPALSRVTAGWAQGATLVVSPASALAALALWFYHRRLLHNAEALDPCPAAERPAWLNFVTQMAFMGLGMGLGVIGLVGVLYTVFNVAEARSLTDLPLALGVFLTGMALWGVHQARLARGAGAAHLVKALWQAGQAQVFALVGWALTLAGLVVGQIWLWDWLWSRQPTGLALALAVLFTGLPLLVYHEGQVRRVEPAARHGWRPLYAGALNLAGLVLGLAGASAALAWLLQLPGSWARGVPGLAALALPGGLTWLYFEFELRRVAGAVRWWQALTFTVPLALAVSVGLGQVWAWALNLRLAFPLEIGGLANGLALTLASGLAWAYYERLVYRHQAETTRPARWLLAWGWQALGAALVTVSAVFTLRWVFNVLGNNPTSLGALAYPFLPALCITLYYRWVMRRVEPGVPVLTRLEVYALSALGGGLAVWGLIATQTWVVSRLSGDVSPSLADALAALLAGLPVWGYFWGWANRLFRHGPEAEQRSNLRKGYLYLIIYLAVHGTVITLGLLVNGVLRGLFGLPTSGNLAAALSVATASALLWVYHALVLRGDVQRAGETSLQGRMQRLYWYLVAAVSLLAFVVGLAGALGGGLRALGGLVLGQGVSLAAREQLTVTLALALAGLPVWLSAWWPAQRAARQPQNSAMRRSVTRRAYLYGFMFLFTMLVLFGIVGVVFQLLSGLAQTNPLVEVVAGVGQALGFAVIGAALWAYHGWVLLGDGKLAQADAAEAARAASAQRAVALAEERARWAERVLLVVDAPAGTFAGPLLAELTARYPYLNVVQADLTAGAEVWERATLIVLPWQLAHPASPVWASPAPKMLIPTDQPGAHWFAATPGAVTPATLASALHTRLSQMAGASSPVDLRKPKE